MSVTIIVEDGAKLLEGEAIKGELRTTEAQPMNCSATERVHEVPDVPLPISPFNVELRQRYQAEPDPLSAGRNRLSLTLEVEAASEESTEVAQAALRRFALRYLQGLV